MHTFLRIEDFGFVTQVCKNMHHFMKRVTLQFIIRSLFKWMIYHKFYRFQKASWDFSLVIVLVEDIVRFVLISPALRICLEIIWFSLGQLELLVADIVLTNVSTEPKIADWQLLHVLGDHDVSETTLSVDWRSKRWLLRRQINLLGNNSKLAWELSI